MPKITTDTVTIAGNSYDIHIFFSDREGGFFIKKGLPDFMTGVVNVGKLIPVSRTIRDYGAPKFETIDKLRTELKTLIETYEAKIKQRRKVIVFTLNIQKATMEVIAPELDHDHYRSHRFQKYGDNIGFTFSYDIGYEYRTGDKVEYTQYKTRQRISEQGEYTIEVGLSVNKGDVVIDWTAENEAFFDRMAESVNNLSKMVFDFFNKDNQELNKLIGSISDNKMPFLINETN